MNDEMTKGRGAVAGQVERPAKPLVERLRALPQALPEPQPFEVWREVCGEAAAAADEIERLRAALEVVARHYNSDWPAPCRHSVLTARQALCWGLGA